MVLEVFTVAAEPTPSAAELLPGTVGVSGQVREGLETEGAGLAEILEFPEVFPLGRSTGEFQFRDFLPVLVAHNVPLDVDDFQRAESTQQFRGTAGTSLKNIIYIKLDIFSLRPDLDVIHHVVGGGGHVAGLTHVVLVLGSQSVLSLVETGLLRHLVLVLDTFTVVREQRRNLGEVAEMALECKTHDKSVIETLKN